jgi:hypothetical protein
MFTKDFRILLVEDHPFQLIALQILLNNDGRQMTADFVMVTLEFVTVPAFNDLAKFK